MTLDLLNDDLNTIEIYEAIILFVNCLESLLLFFWAKMSGEVCLEISVILLRKMSHVLIIISAIIFSFIWDFLSHRYRDFLELLVGPI